MAAATIFSVRSTASRCSAPIRKNICTPRILRPTPDMTILRPRRRCRAPNIPARCIPKWCGTAPARAPNVGWRWSRRCPPSRTEYTCPMHPEIVRDRPGSCPICGMALEPRTVTAAEEPNPELRRHDAAVLDRHRAARVPVLAHGDGARFARGANRWHPRSANGSQLALATPVVLWAGWPFFVRGVASIVNRNLNMFTLIALGVGMAYVYSLVATVFPELFPAAFRGMDGVVPSLLRGGRGDHRAGAAGAGAGAARAQPDRQRDQGAAGPGAEDRAHHPR